jgi:rod shape-determining protein MreD
MSWTFPLTLLACAAMQTVLLNALSVAGVHPDCFLLLVLFWGARVRPEAATLQGFMAGLTQDALSGGPLGLKAFVLSLLGFLIARLSRHLNTEKPFPQLWVLLSAATGAGVLSIGLLSFFLGPPPLLPTIGVMVAEALYTTLLGFLLLRVPFVQAQLAPAA